MSRRKPRVVDTGFSPLPWQTHFFLNKAKVKLALCGLGSGKSSLGAIMAASLMTDPEYCERMGIPFPNFGWVVGQDFPTVLNTAWRETKKFLPVGSYQANEQLHRIKLGDSECQFVTCDDPDSLRAGNVNWIWFDEPGIVRNEEVWQNIIGRARRGVPCVVFLTGTPKGFTWLYEQVWQVAAKCDLLPGNKDVVARTIELDELRSVHEDGNPLYQDYWALRLPSWLSGRVSQEDVDRMKQEMPIERFMQEAGADFTSFTGLVFSDFRSDIHVSDEKVDMVDWWGGMDWGWHDPATVGVFGRTESGWVVEDEFYETRCDPDVQIAWALERQRKYGIKAFFADSARPDLIDRARKMGLRILPADKGPGSIVEGIDCMRGWLRQDSKPPGLIVRPRCLNMIKEFTLYRYPANGVKGAFEVPLDKDNHLIDAARYTLSNHAKTYGLEPMDAVVPGTKKRVREQDDRHPSEIEDEQDGSMYAVFDPVYFL